MKSKINKDEIYMTQPGFLAGNKIVEWNTNSVSIVPYSEEGIEFDFYPKKKKRKKKKS